MYLFPELNTDLWKCGNTHHTVKSLLSKETRNDYVSLRCFTAFICFTHWAHCSACMCGQTAAYFFNLTLAQFTQQPHALVSRRSSSQTAPQGRHNVMHCSLPAQAKTNRWTEQEMFKTWEVWCSALPARGRIVGGAYPNVGVLHSSFGDLRYSAVQTHPFGGVAIWDREWETLNYWVTSDDCAVQLLYKLIREFYGGQKQEKRKQLKLQLTTLA